MQDGMRVELGKEGGMEGSDQSIEPGSCIVSAGSSTVCQQDTGQTAAQGLERKRTSGRGKIR